MIPISLLASIPQHAYDAETVKRNEGLIAQQHGLSLYQLMELAGLAGFELCKQRWPKAKTMLIICGRGNNAGDGFVLARHAMASGMHVYVHSLATIDEYQGDAAVACKKFLNTGGEIYSFNEIDLSRVDVIIDAMLGTGIVGDVRESYGYVINLINQLHIPILSIDLPSGLNANNGQVQGSCIKANVTVCFIALKKGMLTGKAKSFCGDIYLAGLGISEDFSNNIAAKVSLNCKQNLAILKPRDACSHKGTSGFVLAFAGNKGYPGAARLCTEAALRCGAGLVALVCHKDNQIIVACNRPELMLIDSEQLDKQAKKSGEKADVILLGPGLGDDNWAQSCFEYALALPQVKVIDADGLNLLAKNPQYDSNWVLTPHPGEAARLLNCTISDIEQDRYEAVRAIALKYGGICILKGAGTLISDGDEVVVNLTGNAGMASGGMGDVLAGIIAALSLQSDNLFQASCLAVFLHGKAADIAVVDGEKGLLASDLFPFLRQLVNQY